MNAFSLSSLITGVLSLGLSIFVFLRGSRSKLNRLWAITSFLTALWSFGLCGVTFFMSYDNAFYSQVLLDISGILIPVVFLNFVIVLINRKEQLKRILYSFYIFATCLIVLSFSKYFKLGLKEVFEFKHWVNPGPLYIIFPVFFLILIVISVFLLIRYRKSATGIKRQQMKYVLYTAFIGFGGGIFNFLPQFSQIYPIGNFLVGFYIIAITYAMVKYRLMNIRLVITRSILYGVLVGAVAAFFALSVLLVGEAIGGNTKTSKIVTYLVNAFIVVIFLDPVKRVWAKVTDKIFYKDKIDYQDVLQKTSNVLAREIDLEKLLQSTVDILTKKLKIRRISVLVPEENHFKLIIGSGKDQEEFDVSLNFINYLKENEEIAIIEELLRNLEDARVEEAVKKSTDDFIKEAESLKAEMVIPVVEQDKMTAIFLISSKNSGDLYSGEDIDFFKVLIPQVATAIEKSKLYEEVEEFNRELQAKVEERTKSLQVANVALEDRNKFLTTMQVIINMISRTLDLKKVNQMIADSIASELGYVGGILSFVNFEKKVLKVGAITQTEQTQKALALLSQDPREYETKLVEGFNLGAQTVLSGRINFSDKMSDFLSPPVKKEELDKIQKQLGIKTAVGVPVFSEAKIIGIIHFLLPMERKKMSTMDIEMMTAVTNQVGIVSRNLNLYNNLQKANRDLQDANVKLRELDKAKSEFLSIASHQLRTPISAIKGYLSMIVDGDFGKVPKNITKVIKDLFESASRLARLINIFLNVSRIESGRLKLEKKALQINDLIESVVTELANQAKQKGVELVYKKPKGKIPEIFADSDKLREVVLNLVDNAIKYTPQGKIEIFVKFDSKELTFLTKDTGIGIDPKEVKSLFRKFVRGSGVAQIHTGGSGLGLFIAQKIVKEHNGRIWAESKGKGKGSTFQFVVPVYNEKIHGKMGNNKEKS